ncbi:hypothetical protein Hanom_Chr11g01011981 [Helianthus anomalus]
MGRLTCKHFCITCFCVIEIMGDKVGKPINVVVKRAKNASVTLTVIPEEANPDM